MNLTLTEIEFLLNNLPYAAEAYDNSGNLVSVNKAWRDLWHYKPQGLPKISIFKNSLIAKSGIKSKLDKLFHEGGCLRTIPVICEVGDLEFIKKGVDEIFKFYIYSLYDENKKVTFVINLVENVTEDLRKLEADKELESKKKNSATIFEILETERKRVAQELHDVIGQKILLTKLNIELYQKKYSDKNSELKDAINHLIDISKEIKNIIHSLHPVVVEKYSLIDSLDLLTHEFSDSSSIGTTIKYFGSPDYDNLKIDMNIYRIVQESLNNVAKHSSADKVEIECHFMETMFICSISDNGKGFDQFKIFKNGSNKYNYGLISMKERAQAFGGELTIESQSGKGTKIYFQIPTSKVKN